jgi:hypothetical protein
VLISITTPWHCWNDANPQAPGVALQIELLESRGNVEEALDLLRQLCVNPAGLTPPPQGLSVGLTGRPSAWRALALLGRLPEDGEVGGGVTTELALQHLTNWLLEVRCVCVLGMGIAVVCAYICQSTVVRVRDPGCRASCLTQCMQALDHSSLSLSVRSMTTRACLQADSEGSLELLLQQNAVLEPAAALRALRTSSPAVAIAYLQATLAAGATEHVDCDEALAQLYLQRVCAAASSAMTAASEVNAAGCEAGVRAASTDERADASHGDMEGTVTKLLSLIHTSPHIDAAALQKQLRSAQPSDARAAAASDAGKTGVARAAERGLGRVQAALHEHRQEYGEAMRVHVQQLRDPDGAEAFADRLYDALVR